MKRLTAIFLWAAIAFTSSAQKQIELGMNIGASAYLGELNPSRPFHAASPALNLLFIYNFDTRTALRAELGYLQGKSGDANLNPDMFYDGITFSTMMANGNCRFEFNFKQFKFQERKKMFSPYVNAGLGVLYLDGSVSGMPFVATLPMGVGAKLCLGRRLGCGIEYTSYKLFSDKMDGKENPGTYGSPLHNNDWMSYANVYITYKLFDNPGDCAVYW
jgi:hypothetical protein